MRGSRALRSTSAADRSVTPIRVYGPRSTAAGPWTAFRIFQSLTRASWAVPASCCSRQCSSHRLPWATRSGKLGRPAVIPPSLAVIRSSMSENHSAFPGPSTNSIGLGIVNAISDAWPSTVLPSRSCVVSTACCSSGDRRPRRVRRQSGGVLGHAGSV